MVSSGTIESPFRAPRSPCVSSSSCRAAVAWTLRSNSFSDFTNRIANRHLDEPYSFRRTQCRERLRLEGMNLEAAIDQ